MKTIAALILLILSTTAMANMSCGFRPFPPMNCTGGVCVCDNTGCYWVFTCN